VTSPIPASVLARWPTFANAHVRAFGTGLINKTFLAEARPAPGQPRGERAIFQRLHPVFAGSVNEDIDAVTRHLEHKGLVTTRVIPAGDGALFVDDPVDARPWRALTFVNGTSVDRIDSTARASAGGALVAQFHRAVSDLSHAYKHVRAGVHDTHKHLANLARALDEHPAHRLFAVVEPIALDILRAGKELPDFAALPSRNCHGDLKISNVLFDDDGRGICLVDLDTLGLMPWPHEMGDALRSWTNPLGEDVENASVDVDIFRAAVQGYASAASGFVTEAERDMLVDGFFTICLELSSRFLADALQENYFGWNESKFKTRGEHNLLRARGQWSLAQSVRAKRAELEAIVRAEL
jgi:Ser/Thr protein kinase RdoA (MazF antagonist)